MQFAKRFRTGIQVAPFVDGSAEGSNFKGKEREEEFGGKGLEDLFTFRVGTDFLIPLMRGRGGQAIAAGERAALRGPDRHARRRGPSGLQLLREPSRPTGRARDAGIARHLDRWYAAGQSAPRDHLARQRRRAGPGRAGPLAGRRGPRPRPRPRRPQRLYEARVEFASALGVATSGADTSLPTAARTVPGGAGRRRPAAVVGATAAAGQRRDVEAAIRREEAAVIVGRAPTPSCARASTCGVAFYTALGEVGDVATTWIATGVRSTSATASSRRSIAGSVRASR